MKRGRKPKLTPELKEKIYELLRKGNYRNVVCKAVGISEDTFYEWIKRGEKGDKEFSEFSESVKRIESEIEIELVNSFLEIAKKDWKAALEFLSRKYPERWSKKDNIQFGGEVKIEMVSKEDFEKIKEEILKNNAMDKFQDS